MDWRDYNAHKVSTRSIYLCPFDDDINEN